MYGLFAFYDCAPGHYENMPIQIYRKFHLPNLNIFRYKTLIDCGYSLESPRRGGSNEYPQFMFLSRNKKNNTYHCKPHFYYINVGLKGVKIIQACFRYDILYTMFVTTVHE